MLFHDAPEFLCRVELRTEAIDAPPRRNSQSRHEALALDATVGKEPEATGKEEVGLALEARRDLVASIAHPFEEWAVNLALEGARRQEVGEMKGLGLAGCAGERIQEAGVGRIDQATHPLVRLDHADLSAARDECARELMPLLARQVGVDGLP